MEKCAVVLATGPGHSGVVAARKNRVTRQSLEPSREIGPLGAPRAEGLPGSFLAMIPITLLLVSRYWPVGNSAFMFFVIIVLASFVGFTAWDSSVENRE